MRSVLALAFSTFIASVSASAQAEPTHSTQVAAADPSAIPPPVSPRELPASDVPSVTSRATSDRGGPSVAVTISPLYAIFDSFVELTGEYRVRRKVGVAAIGGLGQINGLNVVDGGAQIRYYGVGSFRHGLQLGLEALYVHVGGSRGNAGGASLGPFLGYKYTAGFGLTLELQVGVAATSISVDYMNPAGEHAHASSGGFGMISNINAGWSF